MTTLLLRVAPPVLFSGRRATRLIERNAVALRHSWFVIVSGFFEPLFYLLSIGIGIGKLVGTTITVAGHPVGYTAWVAPALLASSAMNGAIYDSTFNVFFKLKYAKLYDAVLATPLSVADVAIGEIGWALMRGLLYAASFLVVMAALGLVTSPWAFLALPAATLIGFGFAGVGMAASCYLRSWQDFDFVQLVILPLFLLSATFYPLSTYPPSIRWVVELSPLYHGVVLVRAFTTGALDVSLLGHAAFLAAMGIAGLAVTSRRLERLLLH